MKMKKGKYYICCNKNDMEICLHEVTGWISHDDESNLDFGARCVDHRVWEVTELSTGCLVSTSFIKPGNKSDIIPYIARARDTIVRVMESRQDKWFKMCKYTIKKAYEEDKEIET